MGNLSRQTWTLWKKNVRIMVLRYSFSTFFRATLLPIIFIGFISYARNLFVPPAIYGIGTVEHIKDLQTAVLAHPEQRLVFVSNETGGEVDRLISGIANPIRQAGGNVVVLRDSGLPLKLECKQTPRGYSPCFAAVVFNQSPKNSTTGLWNYTLRGASSFNGGRVNVDDHDNDVQQYEPTPYRCYAIEADFFLFFSFLSFDCRYLLPLQFAVDKAIANSARPGSGNVTVGEFMYTSKTQKEREELIRRR
jgi:hypothetical protein